MNRFTLLIASAMFVTSCSDTAEPRAQWSIAIVTNAATPQFGDRLMIEIVAPDGSVCAECRRPIPLDERTVWPVELGVTPPPSGVPPRIRVRLHRSTQTGSDGLPAGTALIDAVGVLPPAVGVTRVVLSLSMECFGVPSDLAKLTTCDPATQALAPEPVLSGSDTPRAMRPGDWAPGKSIPCPRAASSDMVCLPGGAFLLGDPRLIGLSDRLRPSPERLVVLSPFELDRDEMTVGQVRALLAAGNLGAEGLSVRTDDPACTFVEPGTALDDALPVNCVTHDFASNVCRAMGKRLPTEAEWEYAAGSTNREVIYPWGDVADACASTIVGRARSAFENPQVIDESTACRTPEGGPVLPWGVVAGGAPGDITAEGVRNMGGNVREWVVDVFQSYAEPCWVPTGSRFQDPICMADSDLRSLRGAGWADVPLAGASASRSGLSRTAGDADTGFRCARSF